MTEKKKKEQFLKLLAPVYPKLERFAYSLAGTYDDSKDIISETILQAYEAFGSLKDENAFQSFLFTIARRMSSKYRRQSNRTYSLSNEEIDELYSNAANAEILADIKILYKALDELNEEQREAVILHQIFGFKISEIADIQNSNISAVKVRLHRAKAKLKELLGENDNKKIQSSHLIREENK